MNLRVPPGDAADAQRRLVEQLTGAVPWNARISVEPKTLGRPFAARTDGPAYAAPALAMEEAFGRLMVQQGQGGAILLCVALAEAQPAAEILLFGVEEPACRIHAPNESVTRRSADGGGGRPYCYAPSAPDAARSGPNAYRHAFARMGWPLGYSKSCSPSRTNPRRRQSPLDGRFVTFG